MARAAARPRSGAAVLPPVNTLVRLTIGRGADVEDDPVAANVPSRIEDVVEAEPVGKGFGRGGGKGSATHVFVALPHYRGDVDVPRPGTACIVTWVTSDGLYDLPAGFVERVSVGPVVYAWRLEVTGTAQRAQRRRYVRVAWTRPVVVDVIPVARIQTDPRDAAAGGSDGAGAAGPTGDGAAGPGGEAAAGSEGEAAAEEALSSNGGTLHGTTLDLSEGGIRCLLPPPPLRIGQPVRAQLEVAGERLVLDGTVVRAEVRGPAPGAERQCEIGIAFTEPDEHGDLLRRVVFGEQLRSRRSGIA